MMAGIDFSNGEILVSLDAALQNDPTDIPSLLEKLGEGYGGADGLVSKGDDLYLSDWKNGKVFKLDTSMDGSEPVVIKKDMQGSADIDITTDGKYLIIPEMKANRVVIHTLD